VYVAQAKQCLNTDKAHVYMHARANKVHEHDEHHGVHAQTVDDCSPVGTGGWSSVTAMQHRMTADLLMAWCFIVLVGQRLLKSCRTLVSRGVFMMLLVC